METLVTKQNIANNGKIALSIGILLCLFIGFEILVHSKTKAKEASMTIKEHVPELCEEFGYLSVEPKGRLGNFISQYATLYGVSKFYGVPPVIYSDMKDRLRQMFKHTSIPVFTNKTCQTPFYCKVSQMGLVTKRLLNSVDCNFKITGHHNM